MIAVDEEARDQEARENAKNVHLCANHCCDGPFLLREPVSGDLCWGVVKQGLPHRYDKLPSQCELEALVDEAPDPEAESCGDDTTDNAPAQATLFDDVDAREVHGQVERHEAVGHEVHDEGRDIIQLVQSSIYARLETTCMNWNGNQLLTSSASKNTGASWIQPQALTAVLQPNKNSIQKRAFDLTTLSGFS